MNTLLKFFFCCFALNICVATAQDTDLRIGEWQTHNPYNSAVSVTQSTENIYYATTQAIIIIEKVSRETSYITRKTGLSDVAIAKIAYNRATRKLLVAYQNGNLDIIDNDGNITNVSDILRANIAGTRDVNHIYFKLNMAYLACDFGLVQLNMANLQVVRTTFTPDRRATSFALQNDTLWLATTKGLLWCTPDRNLQDFGQWRTVATNFAGLRPDAPNRHIVNFKNTLVADANDSLFILRNNTWQFLYAGGKPDFDLISIEPTADFLVLGWHRDAGADYMQYLYESGYEYRLWTDRVSNIRQTTTERFTSDSSHVWVADVWVGMGYFSVKDYKGTKTNFNCPQGNRCRRAIVHPDNRDLFIATGSINGDYQYTVNADGIAHYSKGIWKNYNRATNNAQFGGAVDAVAIVVRPSDGHIFTGMYASENRPFLIETDADGKFVRAYDKRSGSTMQTAVGDTGSIRVIGMAVDAENNIWLLNRDAPNPVSVLRPDGTWRTFQTPFPSVKLRDIAIDGNDIKWITANDGLIAFDDGDLDKNGDERIKILTPSNSKLNSANTSMPVVDLDGDVWVGTTAGATVFQCGTSIFQENTTCKGSNPLACINSVCEDLLKQSVVNCITVDGANRKWFGTPAGIFVQTPDGRNTVVTFNKDNAPLPSNDILSITMDDKNGLVWILTVEGLVSYRTDAAFAQKIPSENNIIAFPNPVRPDYTGPIAINGFVRDAIVKITDVAGTLVYETTALGSQVVWSGNDYNGKRASTGVYLVYTSNNEGEQALVAKIAVVN
jgi:ligand-binding sensor domain-containing protein